MNFDTLKGPIAHEWGHYLAFHLLGYGETNEGIIIEIDRFGPFGHTTNFARPKSLEDELIIIYSGVIAEEIYSGRKIRISYTDAARVRNLAVQRKQRDNARKQAFNLLFPYSNEISKLVSLTLTREAYKRNCYVNFYDRIFKGEALQYLREAGL